MVSEFPVKYFHRVFFPFSAGNNLTISIIGTGNASVGVSFHCGVRCHQHFAFAPETADLIGFESVGFVNSDNLKTVQ